MDVYHHVAMVKHRYHAVWMPGEKLQPLEGKGDPPRFSVMNMLMVGRSLEKPQRNCTQRSRVDLGFEIVQTQHPAQAKWQYGDVGEESITSKNYRVFA